MRSADEVKYILDSQSNPVGIILTPNFCSEHEWGIKELDESLGVSDKGYGIDRRRIENRLIIKCVEVNCTITCGDESITQIKVVSLLLPENAPEHILDDGYAREFAESSFKRIRIPRDNVEKFNDIKDGKIGMTAAKWSNRSFIIAAIGEAETDILHLIRTSAEMNNVIIDISSNPPFSKVGGLYLALIHRLPKDFIDSMHEKDRSAELLKKAHKRTNIEAKLKKAGKEWFALSPRWKNGKAPEKLSLFKNPKSELVWWLNPRHQRIDNYGQFTYEELMEWTENKGPIPMRKAS